jgi:hypothetical protein
MPIDILQLSGAIVGLVSSLAIAYFAFQARARYISTGENDPDVTATAMQNIRDEIFRVAKHSLLVSVGIVTVMLKNPGEALEPRAIIVRWILLMISALMVVQSLWIWRDRAVTSSRARARDRRTGDQNKAINYGRRAEDKRVQGRRSADLPPSTPGTGPKGS